MRNNNGAHDFESSVLTHYIKFRRRFELVKVTLSQQASSDTPIVLSCNNTLLNLPASPFIVPANSDNNTFTATALQIPAGGNQTVTITAALNGSSQTATLTLVQFLRPWMNDRTAHLTYKEITDKAGKINSAAPSSTDSGLVAITKLETAYENIYSLLLTNSDSIAWAYGIATTYTRIQGPKLSSTINIIQQFAAAYLIDKAISSMDQAHQTQYLTDLQNISTQLKTAQAYAEAFTRYVQEVAQHVDALVSLYKDATT